MATSGARSGRSVPEILRQNCYLTDAVPIPEADPSSKRGKFLHRHGHPTYHFWIARWDTVNRCSISVFDTRKGSSPGSLLGEMWYPASAEIIDACMCRFDMGQPGLVVAVYDAARQEYPYYLSYVVIGLGYVVKTIGMDFPITSVTCLMDSAEVSHRKELASEFEGFPQIVVVGTEQGHCFLTHFGVSRIDAPPLDVDVRTPVKPPKSIDCSMPYQKKTGGFQPAYTNEDNVSSLNSSDVMVTSLCYVARCYTLFIGYNFGAVQTLNLATKSIGMMHVSPGPVISFAIQEPEDDPRPQLFLWIGCNGRRDARPVLKLYVVNFASSEKDVEATYETAIYSKPMVHPFLEWFPEECSRLISLRTVYLCRSEADQIRKEDDKPFTIGAGGGFGSDMKSTLMLCSWIAKRSDSFYGSLFDLDNLYFRQLARRIETDETPAKQFYTMAVFSSAECETSEFVLKANEINDVVMNANYGLTRFKNKSSDYADQLQYPSTYQFKCFALTNTQLGDLRVPPLQRQVLERYAISLRDIVEKPMLPSQYLRAIGIQSQNAAQMESKPDLAQILSAMLYYDHVDEILSLVKNLEESLTSNVTLKDIGEWVWLEVKMMKERLDAIANLIRTNMHPSPEEKRFIPHACYVFQMASKILLALTERVSGSAKETLDVKCEATKGQQHYAEFIQFHLESEFLPETGAPAYDALNTTEISFNSVGNVDSYTPFKSTSMEAQGKEDFVAEIDAEKHHEVEEVEPIVVTEMIEEEPAVDEPEAQLEPIVEEALNTSMEEQGEVDFAAEIAAEHHEEKELEPIVVDEMIEVEPAVDEPEAQLEPIVEEEEEKTPKQTKMERDHPLTQVQAGEREGQSPLYLMVDATQKTTYEEKRMIFRDSVEEEEEEEEKKKKKKKKEKKKKKKKLPAPPVQPSQIAPTHMHEPSEQAAPSAPRQPPSVSASAPAVILSTPSPAPVSLTPLAPAPGAPTDVTQLTSAVQTVQPATTQQSTLMPVLSNVTTSTTSATTPTSMQKTSLTSASVPKASKTAPTKKNSSDNDEEDSSSSSS